MRDLDPHAYGRLRQAIGDLGAFLGERGYEAIDTPMLEETELFVRKSGGELTSRLYTFIDPGGHRVSLRPEFTSSVIRHFIEARASLALPVRWQYAGPVFRYEQEEHGYRQFTQIGAELVGATGVESDAEVITLASDGLNRLGLRGQLLRIGHLGVLRRLLDAFELSEAAKLFIISNVQALKTGRTDASALRGRAEAVGLLREGSTLGASVSLKDMSADRAQEFVQEVLRESMPAPVGRRTSAQIVSRLLRKVSESDDPARFEDALTLVSQLGRLDGRPEAVLREARRVASSSGMGAEPFDELDGLFSALKKARGFSDEMVLDLGLARGISYYTGVIFELTYNTASLGGGGRYDELVRALGGDEDCPALGFAYNLDQVVDTLEQYSLG